MIAPATGDPLGARPWWETRAFVTAMVVLAAVPLLYPTVPPLVDLPGHIGRYRVELDLAQSPDLQRFFDFHWALIGNLGVDLLVWPLGKLIGLEPAVKLIVLAIPPMTVAGMLWVAREVHGRLPPTASLPLAFAFGHPLLFGFVNFALSMALAFLAFGLWLRLARTNRLKLRAALFVPISCLVWLTHTFGWGALGLLCFSAEAVRQHDKGRGWLRAGWRSVYHSLPLALPVVPTLAWRRATGHAPTVDWFDWSAKWEWLAASLRDRWQWFDVASLVIVLLFFSYAVLSRRLTFSRHLGFSTLIILAAFLALPRVIFGSAYADMRLAPFLFALAVLAIRARGETHLPTSRLIAALAVGFLVVRTAAVTASLGIAADDQSTKLAALDHVPRGARVISFVARPCGARWAMPRNDHLGAMAIARRNGFSNDQWLVSGANLLTLRNIGAGRFAADPSQKVRDPACFYADAMPIGDALASFPRGRFDYLWLIDPPPFDPALVASEQRVWSRPGSALYRLAQPTATKRP